MRHANSGITMDTYGHLMAGAFQGMGERLDDWLRAQVAAREGNTKATAGQQETVESPNPAS